MNTPDNRERAQTSSESQAEPKTERKLQLGKRVLKQLVVRTNVKGGLACDSSRVRCCG